MTSHPPLPASAATSSPSPATPSAASTTGPSRLEIPVQPCTDPRCAIHARGADPVQAAREMCPRQILRAYDRADAIALLEQEVPVDRSSGQRILLPFRSDPLCQGESARIRCPGPDFKLDPEIESFRAGEIVLVATNANWRIDDILMGGKSQIAPHLKLPAEIFGQRLSAPTVRAFDRIGVPLDIEIVATRVHGAESAPLVGAILGTVTRKAHDIQIQSSGRIPRGAIAQLDTRSGIDLDPTRLVIPNGSESWVVHGIQIDEASMLTQNSGLPGEMFGPDVIDAFVRFPRIQIGMPIQMRVQYIGDDPEGGVFSAVLRGHAPPIGEVGEVEIGSVASARVPAPSAYTVPIRSPQPVPAKATVELVAQAAEPMGPYYRFVIEEACEDWIVNALQIGDTNVVASAGGDLPGDLFGPNAMDSWFVVGDQPIAPGTQIKICVTYIGSDAGGKPLVATLRGQVPRGQVPAGSFGEDMAVPIESPQAVPPQATVELATQVAAEMAFSRLVIDDGGEDWIVTAFHARGANLLAQSGEMPGAAFAPDALPPLASFPGGPFHPGESIKIGVRYIGTDPAGKKLVAAVRGWAPRDGAKPGEIASPSP